MPRKSGQPGEAPLRVPNKNRGIIILPTVNGYLMQTVPIDLLPRMDLTSQTWVTESPEKVGEILPDILRSLHKSNFPPDEH
jgi:hypothetical protein